MTNPVDDKRLMESLKAVKRRHIVRAAVTGASVFAVAGVPEPARAQRAQFRFRLQSFLGPGNFEWEDTLPRFIRRVREMSGGRIEIQPFPPGALVPTFEMLDGVINRVVDIGYGAQVYWRGRFPLTLFSWGIPFAFERIEQYDYLWHEAGLNKLVSDTFATVGVKFLGPIYSDEWGATMSRREIRRLTDFRGLKVRSFGIAAEIWKSFGASIVTVPGEEIYTALATGVADAANWGSPYGFAQLKLEEVAKFYLGPPLIWSDMEDSFMNMAAWNSLPAELQQVMETAQRIWALERYTRAAFESARVVERMKRAGVTFNTMAPEDLATMKRLTAEFTDRLAGNDRGAQQALRIIRETQAVFAQRPDGV